MISVMLLGKVQCSTDLTSNPSSAVAGCGLSANPCFSLADCNAFQPCFRALSFLCTELNLGDMVANESDTAVREMPQHHPVYTLSTCSPRNQPRQCDEGDTAPKIQPEESQYYSINPQGTAGCKRQIRDHQLNLGATQKYSTLNEARDK